MTKILLLKDGKFITCSEDNTIRIWNFDKTIPEKVLTGHIGKVLNMIVLRSGKLCSAGGTDDRMIKIWNLEKEICEQTFSGYPGQVSALVELPNDILIGGGEDQIRFWDLRCTNSDEACKRILPNKGKCRSIILLNNEEMACASGRNVNIFRIHGGDTPLMKFTGHQGIIWDLLLHKDRQRLVSSSDDRTMRMWNIHNGSCIRTYTAVTACHRMVWFYENIVATGYNNGEIKFWNIYSGKCVRTLVSEKIVPYRLMVDNEGRLISCGFGDTISIWSN